MSIKNILFDLDGTLLPMDQEEFIKAYFGLLAKRLAPCGYEPQALFEAIWSGTRAMVNNDGTLSNEAVFWNDFAARYGEQARQDEAVFAAYYREDFDRVRSSCGYTPQAAETIRRLKEGGYRLVLATNPIFPAVATEKRMAWAGLNKEDFALYTTYENSHYCKPNPAYYREILEKLGMRAEECVMVGNDATEDLAAAELGMEVFLLTDCLINKEHKALDSLPRGGFEDLWQWLDGLHKDR